MDRKVDASGLSEISMISDAGTLPLILYSHGQLLAKIAELKDNALYVEKISTESAPAPKKSKPSRKSLTKATPSTSTSQPEASSSRRSDPQHSEEQLVLLRLQLQPAAHSREWLMFMLRCTTYLP